MNNLLINQHLLYCGVAEYFAELHSSYRIVPILQIITLCAEYCIFKFTM